MSCSSNRFIWQATNVHPHPLSTEQTDPFELYWDHPAPWFEPKNQRRGGWSGVSQIEFAPHDGPPFAAFLKRQENHTYRAPQTLMRAAPTLKREFGNLRQLADLGFLVPQPLFYGERIHAGKIQAILIVRALEGFQSLRDFLKQCQAPSDENRHRLRKILPAVGAETAKLHAHGWAHHCLHPKHIFVTPAGSVAFIDLESARRPLLMTRRHVLKELGPLYRRCSHLVSRQDCMRFLYAYTHADRPSPQTRALALQTLHSKKINPRPTR